MFGDVVFMRCQNIGISDRAGHCRYICLLFAYSVIFHALCSLLFCFFSNQLFKKNLSGV